MQLRKQSQFNARKKFQYAILCVRAMVRIKRLRYTLEPLKIEDAMRDPYRVKILRKVMDEQFYKKENKIKLINFSYLFSTIVVVFMLLIILLSSHRVVVFGHFHRG